MVEGLSDRRIRQPLERPCHNDRVRKKGTRMWLRVLGSAAGGGFPQWNCRCPGCNAVREGSRPCQARTQSSVVVSLDRKRWFLINASPDIRAQIESLPTSDLGQARVTPLAAVLLTDAELDHTLGLLLLREGRGLEVHATQTVHETLCDGTSLLRTLERYCPVEWKPVVPGTDVSLGMAFTTGPLMFPRPSGRALGPGMNRDGWWVTA